jgi:hypothetical protein
VEQDDSAWAHNTGNGGLPGGEDRTDGVAIRVGPNGRWGPHAYSSMHPDAPPAGHAPETDGSHKPSLAQKLHGEANVFLGKLTGNEHLVEEGEALKHGSKVREHSLPQRCFTGTHSYFDLDYTHATPSINSSEFVDNSRKGGFLGTLFRPCGPV